MEASKKLGPCQIESLGERKFLEAMEKRVNDDNVGVQTINSGRKDKVEPKSMDPAIPKATDPVQQEPGEKLQELRAGHGWHSMPDDRSRVLRACVAWLSNGKIFNALGVEMNLAKFFASEAFQQFGNGTLSTVPAVNEG